MDGLKATIDQQVQLDAKKLRLRFLPRTLSVCVLHVKMDPTNWTQLAPLFQQVDRLVDAAGDDDDVSAVLSAVGEGSSLEEFRKGFFL